MSIHGKQAEQGTYEKTDMSEEMPGFSEGVNKPHSDTHKPELIRRARKFNVRSEQGNADKTGGWGR